ncbi:MAG: hypothetical protein C4K58_03275 [Flavobacteriaceae bacterium]|nr:MAG: hypothetical protein C4K58_03275 [Flavobacteriaceae bacterium]
MFYSPLFSLKNTTALFLGFCLAFVSCYSFTGSSLSPETKTIKIDYFDYTAALYNATFSQEFTEALQDRFRQRTTLNLSNTTADIELTGEVSQYRIDFATVTGNNNDFSASQNRLTIEVKVKYNNALEPEKNFYKTYTKSGEFEQGQAIVDVEKTLHAQISELLIEEIFNDIVAQW